MVLLAVGILIVQPELKMPALTKFMDGTGPVWAGSLFPFLFITIACGAVSGFHALIASGTTPKMLENERQIPMIGYGAMLTEFFVAIMAMIGASVLQPGVYFAMNSPAAVIGPDVVAAAAKISSWGFALTPDMMTQLAQEVGEKTLLSRVGGAPTLAVGMAYILSGVSSVFGATMMGVWYHFAILFEALFILTTVDAGTRVARFMIQDTVGSVVPAFKNTENWFNNVIGSALAVSAWGYFLYQGVIDPLGGIRTLWPLFGISNQMLAGIALIACTVILFKMKRERYAWVTLIPTTWLLVCTLTAGLQKIFTRRPASASWPRLTSSRRPWPRARCWLQRRAWARCSRIIFNNYLNAALAAAFVIVVVAIAVYGVICIRRALGNPSVTSVEVGGMAAAE